jgi:anti-sigma factor RsiW
MLEILPVQQECPPDIAELAESYHLGHLSPEEAAALETHCLGCSRCTAELERAETYIAAIRAAARQVRDKQPPKPSTRRSA